MGYRSEVAFAIAPPLVDKFLAVMAASEKVRDLIKFDEKYKEGIEFDKYEKGDIFVYLGSIKWYEGYEEIDKIKEFFDELIHNPTKILGYIASTTVISSALGIILTGLVLALEGFSGSSIAYDINGWFKN